MERFYDAVTVTSDCERATRRHHSDFYGDFDAIGRIAERNKKAKRGLNAVLFGNEETSYGALALTPNSSRIAAAFTWSLDAIMRAARPVGIDASVRIIRANQLDSGAKFSRALLRAMKADKSTPIADIASDVYGIQQELPNMPKDATFEVFLQNFYSALAAFKAQINVSTDLYDMLTASEYTGDWGSCYRWDHSHGGAHYASSTVVRSLDKMTAMVFLTQSGSINKIGRFWVTFADSFDRFAVFPTYGDFSEKNVLRAVEFIKDAISVNIGHDKDGWEYQSIPKSRSDNAVYDTDFFDSEAYIDSPQYAFKHTKAKEWQFYPSWPSPRCLCCGSTHDTSNIICEDCADQSIRTCDACGERVHEDELFYDDNRSESLCQSCYDDRHANCPECHCSIYIGSEDDYEVDGLHYCETCYTDTFRSCDYCEETHRYDDLTEVHGDQYVCQYCLDKHYAQCDDCEEYFPKDDVNDCGHITLCDTCLEWALDYDADADDGIMAKAVFFYMYQESIFYTLNISRFPHATPCILKPEEGDYITLDPHAIYGNPRTYQLAVDQTPCLVTYVYRHTNPNDRDVCVRHDGIRTIIKSEKIYRIVPREIVLGQQSHTDVYFSMFYMENFRSIDNAIFPEATFTRTDLPTIQAGDLVILRSLDSMTSNERHAAPNIAHGMEPYFDGQTQYEVTRIYDGQRMHGETWFSIAAAGGWTFTNRWIAGVN